MLILFKNAYFAYMHKKKKKAEKEKNCFCYYGMITYNLITTI